MLTTGYAKRLDADPGFAVLRKPYHMTALSRAIREALDARARRGNDGKERPPAPVTPSSIG